LTETQNSEYETTAKDEISKREFIPMELDRSDASEVEARTKNDMSFMWLLIYVNGQAIMYAFMWVLGRDALNN
jgi:hypothetical protein